MKEKLRLSSIILMIIETICFFIPRITLTKFWRYDNYVKKWHQEWHHNLFPHFTHSGFEQFLGKLLLVLMLITIITTILIYLKPKSKFYQYIDWLPTINFCLLIFYAVYVVLIVGEEGDKYSGVVFKLDWLFYVIFALHILTLLCSYLIKFKKFPEVVKNNRNIDELIKYKELLDKNVITQEEFELKKKQILNL